jgi:hypothetical protein
MPAYNTLAIDLGPGTRAAGFSENDFLLFTSANRQTWTRSRLVVSISVSLYAGTGGGDLILIRFLSPPPPETPYFRVILSPNQLSGHFRYTMLDFDLRTWKRL